MQQKSLTKTPRAAKAVSSAFFYEISYKSMATDWKEILFPELQDDVVTTSLLVVRSIQQHDIDVTAFSYEKTIRERVTRPNSGIRHGRSGGTYLC